MANASLARRVKILEEKMDALSVLYNEFVSFRAEVREEFGKVREEMRAGDEETRRQMRVLHEKVISRLALLQESRRRRN